MSHAREGLRTLVRNFSTKEGRTSKKIKSEQESSVLIFLSGGQNGLMEFRPLQCFHIGGGQARRIDGIGRLPFHWQ